MEVLIQAAQFILSLSILVILHEFGHYLPAKYFGTRVEKFYLFYNYKFSLFKKKIGETEWGIGWIPFGGYVKIAGMVDESMDTEQLQKPAEPWEFRSKPAWQRLIIILGGVTVNLILGYLLYVFILFYYGKTYIPVDAQVYGVKCDSLMLEHGFADGDKILAFNNKPLEAFNRIDRQLLLDNIELVTIERDGKTLDISLPADFGQQMINRGVRSVFALRIPTIVDEVQENTGAKDAGIQKGDQIISIDGENVPFFNDFSSELQKYKGQTLPFGIVRGGDTLVLDAAVSQEGTLGFRADVNVIKKEKITYSFLEALPAGFNTAGDILTGYVISIKYLFSKSGAKNMGGLISIGSMFSPQWDWESFWSITAFLSLVLAFMNILPIPALDGGHAIFIIYEMIVGKKPSDKFLEKAQTIGILLLLGLMVFALGNDIWRFIISKFL